MAKIKLKINQVRKGQQSVKMDTDVMTMFYLLDAAMKQVRESENPQIPLAELKELYDTVEGYAFPRFRAPKYGTEHVVEIAD